MSATNLPPQAGNKARSAEATKRMHAALDQATNLHEAFEYYGRERNNFWAKTAQMGIKAQVQARFADDIATEERERYETNARINAEIKANFIEDAEWLALTGETLENAPQRLGLNSENNLFTRLSRYGRNDLFAKLAANGEDGYVRAGRISGPTHGSRM